MRLLKSKMSNFPTIYSVDIHIWLKQSLTVSSKLKSNYTCRYSQAKLCRTDLTPLLLHLYMSSHFLFLLATVGKDYFCHLATSPLTHSAVGHSGLELFKLWNCGGRNCNKEAHPRFVYRDTCRVCKYFEFRPHIVSFCFWAGGYQTLI